MKMRVAVVDKEDLNGYFVEVELNKDDWDRDIMETIVERGVVKAEVDTVMVCDRDVSEELKKRWLGDKKK